MPALQTAILGRGGTRLPFKSEKNAAVRPQGAVQQVRAAASSGAADGRDTTGLSSLRVFKPSASDMERLMQEWKG
jgi:hypothetical protein